ncbi:hypothetical protein PR048_005122 [Dryococelus australis]|uniref:Uncharacterized protein n=1 Tax=Dryococelus australis TaxID=614101 RepID=A0ABQ9I7C5_9NEOP|nr:hypothetical protein PR048_005122 [Dryococelus australis]
MNAQYYGFITRVCLFQIRLYFDELGTSVVQGWSLSTDVCRQREVKYTFVLLYIIWSRINVDDDLTDNFTKYFKHIVTFITFLVGDTIFLVMGGHSSYTKNMLRDSHSKKQ